MPYIFKLPDLGEGMTEGEIVKWYVAAGDSISEDDPLLELQNDKLSLDIPSPVSGAVSRILVPEGSSARVGEPLIEIASADADSVDAESAKAASTTPPPQVQVEHSGSSEVSKNEGQSVRQGALAMPSVRKRARELGISLEEVEPTGKHGHVTMEDLARVAGASKVSVAANAGEASAEQRQAQPYPTESGTPAPRYGEEPNEIREKMSITRRAIVKRMTLTAFSAPHVAIFDEVEVSRLVAHRERFKPFALERGVKLTYMAYIAKALLAVAKKIPVLNATLDEEQGEIIYKKYYNLGIAVETERGLYVPNIKDADKMSLYEIASEIARLAEAARAGTLSSQEMREGTITITNIGPAGGMWFTPLLNYPEVAIMGTGRIEKKAIVNAAGDIVVGQMLMLSLSFDHRLIDGATAQLAMNEFKKLVSDPEYLLMEG